MNNPFTEEYYMDGPRHGLSNYRDYRWLPDQTLPMADHARWLLDIKPNENLYEVGCARGFFIKALRMRGVDASGYDISPWAIENCDPAVKDHVSLTPHLPEHGYSVVWSKDVLEHVPEEVLRDLVPQMLKAARRLVFIIVPLAQVRNGAYGCPVDEEDSTHLIRWTLPCWIEFLQEFSRDFVVSGGYQMPVLKPNCYHHDRAYGFISARRIAS